MYLYIICCIRLTPLGPDGLEGVFVGVDHAELAFLLRACCCEGSRTVPEDSMVLCRAQFRVEGLL